MLMKSMEDIVFFLILVVATEIQVVKLHLRFEAVCGMVKRQAGWESE